MYQAKERGRRTYMVYTEAMDAAARLRATTVAALRKALERNEFSLVYQPKLSLLDERITGVEALLRWRSEELGNVPPTAFIPIAEETGMIIEIGDWVVSQACAQLARWRDAGIRDVTMSVNVSVLQLLRGELTQRLCDILAEHDIAPNQLELELTESMVMANAEQSITTLRQLKARRRHARDRRFRHRLFVAELSEAPADRYAEDRQGIRRRHHHRSRRRGDHGDRHHDGAFARPQRHRRRRRERRAGRIPSRAGLRRDPGPLAFAAAAAGSVPGVPARPGDPAPHRLGRDALAP